MASQYLLSIWSDFTREQAVRFLDLTDGPPCGETSHSLWWQKRLRPSPNQLRSGALPGGTV